MCMIAGQLGVTVAIAAVLASMLGAAAGHSALIGGLVGSALGWTSRLNPDRFGELAMEVYQLHDRRPPAVTPRLGENPVPATAQIQLA